MCLMIRSGCEAWQLIQGTHQGENLGKGARTMTKTVNRKEGTEKSNEQENITKFVGIDRH